MFEVRASIRPRSITVYSQYLLDKRHGVKSSMPLAVTRDHGVVQSQKSRSRMRTALDILIYTARYKTVFVVATQQHFRYKINFITLTLPSAQCHSDKEIIKRIFSPFMEAWVKRSPGLLYVYKIEVQDNGNVHFHVVTNTFYHYRKLREDWNRACEKLGYVSRGTVSDPNSTDVHALSNRGDIANYLTSYMSKKDLYKKPLKRWLQVYKSKLGDPSREVVQLPRRYFEMIKRRVTSNAWNASKLLLNFKVTSVFNRSEVAWRMLEIMKQRGCFIHRDYVDILLIEKNCFTEFPEFKKLVDQRLKEVRAAQKRVRAFSEVLEL